MLKQKVRDLVSLGYGRRKIAQTLGVSEYKVRAILRSIVVDKIRKEDTNDFDGRLRISRIKSGKDKKKVAVVLSDIHIPYHDRDALAIALEFTEDIKPDKIILAGDIIDFYAVSKYMKDPLRIDTLQSEIDETRAFLNVLRDKHLGASITIIPGNHEVRLEKFLIDKASALTSLRCLSIDDLFGLSQNGIVFSDASVMLGKLEVTHGEYARKTPGGSVKGHFEKSASSVLVGHVHRLNTNRYTNGWGVHTVVENGCLCMTSPEYSRVNDWQQGFSVVRYNEKTGDFIVEQHNIVGGKLITSDRVYQCPEKK
jgi:predicted phosphodiesterase